MKGRLVVIGLAAFAAACDARTIQLDEGDAGVQGSVPGTSEVPPGTAEKIVTCGDAPQMSATLGYGYRAMRPAECDAPQGSTAPVHSAADVAALLPGLWYDCDQKSFGIDLVGDNVQAMQLTSDGRYVAYGLDESSSLVPLASASIGAGTQSDGGSTGPYPGATGTYEVVDGSATYGPGAYALQLHPDSGGLFEGQAIVSTGPVQLHFLPAHAAAQVLVPALPWSPRRGVCSCLNVVETSEYDDDAANLAKAIVGKWLWCAGSGGGPMGIEFDGDGAWYVLNEDPEGNVTRSAANTAHGTFSIVKTAEQGVQGQDLGLGGAILTIKLDPGGGTQVLYFPNPRVLYYSVGPVSLTGPYVNDYSILLPMP
jgi:hypothetical protein